MKIMVSSFKRSHECPATLSVPTLSRPSPTHGSAGGSWTLTASLAQSPVGSLLLSPGSWCTRCCFALQESISQTCVSSGSTMLGLMVTSSKRTYAIPTPRASVPVADHHQPVPPQQTLKHSSVSVSVGSLGPDAHMVCLSLLSLSGRNGI